MSTIIKIAESIGRHPVCVMGFIISTFLVLIMFTDKLDWIIKPYEKENKNDN